MTAPVDVVNRALSSIGARTVVNDINTEDTPSAVQARQWYAVCRQRLLRAAPWGFARRTIILTELARVTDSPNTVPYPWVMKYAYPADCEKVRYILPPPWPPAPGEEVPNVSSVLSVPWCAPSRKWRFLPEYDPALGQKVLLANVPNAYAVYTADVQNPELWDALFMDALEAYLASKMVFPLTGNRGMIETYFNLATQAVTQARGVDGNEAIPTTDHSVDWMVGRNSGGYGNVLGTPEDGVGFWYTGYDLNWGM